MVEPIPLAPGLPKAGWVEVGPAQLACVLREAGKHYSPLPLSVGCGEPLVLVLR